MDTIINGVDFELKSDYVQINRVLITPPIATKWLGTQVRNRPEQTHSMLGYRADMISGRWTFAGDPIRFDTEGHLIDGQNRLTALSGIHDQAFALEFMVVTGLPTDTQLVMDQGARRTAGQQLGLKGIPSGSNIAAGIRMLIFWERGLLFGGGDSRAAITNTHVTEWAQAHPAEVEIALERLTHLRQIGFRPSSGMAFILRLGQALEEEGREFVREMHDLSDLPAGSPTLALAKRIARARHDPDFRLSDVDQLGFLVYTWNNWVRNKSATRLQRPKGGWTLENFPIPDGV